MEGTCEIQTEKREEPGNLRQEAMGQVRQGRGLKDNSWMRLFLLLSSSSAILATGANRLLDGCHPVP